MNIDTRTLALIMGMINFLQVIAFLIQNSVNKVYRGIGCWLLWSILTALGFTFMLSRNYISTELIPVSIIITNILLLAGQLSLYTGIMRFLGRKEHLGIIISLFVVFTISTLYVVCISRNENARVIIFYIALSVIAFLSARGLFVYKTKMINASANFLAAIFLIHGVYFTVRTAMALKTFPIDSVFTPTILQTATFIVAFITGILWAFGLIIMINQRSTMEDREDKQNLQQIFNTSPDAASITRLTDGCFVDINEGFTTLTGFTRDDVIGKTALEINLWHNPADRHKLVAEVKEKGYCNNIEYTAQCKDGHQAIGIMSAKIISLQGVPHLISIARDITERKQMEISLRENEEKYRLLVENSHDIIYSLNAEGVFIFVSPIWTRLLGHPVTEVVGKSFQFFVHPDDIPDCMIFLKSVVETGERQSGIEYRVRHRDGTWYWHTSSAVPFRDEAGNILGFYGIARDITEHKEIQKEREKLILELQESLAKVKTLSGMLPICASCKKIRNDKGYWEQMEMYISDHSDAEFSHGICPECAERLYPEYYKKL